MKKGFTLVELLVVIAIIGILAAITIISLQSQKLRARDGVIKGELKSARLEADVFANDHSASFTGVCADPEFQAFTDGASKVYNNTTTTDICNVKADGTEWAAYVPLNLPPSGTTGWCVDSAGSEKATMALGGATLCP